LAFLASWRFIRFLPLVDRQRRVIQLQNR
jgi:hypothetical protein